METFIREYQLPSDVCQKLLKAFDDGYQCEGMVGNGFVDKEIKDSTDIVLSQHPHVMYLYYSHLVIFIKDYLETFDARKAGFRFNFSEDTNVQRYLPSQGYHGLHSEKNPMMPMVYRELVFMTYLNTLTPTKDNQGCTEFPYQNYFGQPVEGNTLIWPSGFTHAHRGIAHHTETKFIATGWYHWLE